LKARLRLENAAETDSVIPPQSKTVLAGIYPAALQKKKALRKMHRTNDTLCAGLLIHIYF
jgi:hypothetical protein